MPQNYNKGYMGIMEKKMEITILGLRFRVSQNEGYLFWGSLYNKDYNSLVSIIWGPPI